VCFRRHGVDLLLWEIPRLCRGGIRSLTVPEVCFSSYKKLASRGKFVVLGFDFDRLRSGPFEGPATAKPPALPEDAYCSAALHAGWYERP
jgi:hypothetical protein